MKQWKNRNISLARFALHVYFRIAVLFRLAFVMSEMNSWSAALNGEVVCHISARNDHANKRAKVVSIICRVGEIHQTWRGLPDDPTAAKVAIQRRPSMACSPPASICGTAVRVPA
ncbi:hypothetical protein [Sphingobium yanoikuyae]|uniref:hypothetical protein n=1 Tax=Sphingobium yanoikuyae TaxID=13690 RepID=UPI0012D2CC45|nr:hypothetical protein [Sphingobium yanoikuyae]